MKEKELKLDELDKVTGGNGEMPVITCPQCGKSFPMNQVKTPNYHDGYCPFCGAHVMKFY